MGFRVENTQGKPIVDADTDVVIEVASGDIRKGKAMSPTECAIAQSCKRSLGVINATINKSTAYLEYADKIVRYLVPEAATREVVSLDRGGKFAEGIYHLRRPSKTERIGAHRMNGKPRGKSAGQKAKKAHRRHVTVMVRGA